VAQSVVAHPW